MKARWSLVVAGCVLLLSAAVCFSVRSPLAHADQAKAGKAENTLNSFMRKKLGAASDVLEGLTTEDGQLIAKGANAMAEMSRVELWQVLTDGDYRNFSRDFRETAKKLAEAGEKGNFDAAALHWIKVTTACIDCHKYVRQQRAEKK